MPIKLMTLTTALLLLACGQGGGASGSGGPPRVAKPLDVAGVAIGMSARDAQAALNRGGWTTKPFVGDTWKQTVARIVARQRGDFLTDGGEGVGGWNATKADESIEVELHAGADGGRVRQVTYHAPIAGRSSSDFRTGLYPRYGKPTSAASHVYRDGAIWCSPGEQRCADAGVDPAEPYLESAYDEGSQGKVTLFLREGSAATAAWTRERDAAVRAASGSATSY